MQRSKTRVWTEGRHRPAVSTSSIYSSSFGLLTSAIATPGSSSPTTNANRGERSMLGFNRWHLFKGLAVILCIVSVVSLALVYFVPAPPSKLTIATGAKSQTYETIGKRYREILARSHVDVELRLTNGAVENVKLLKDPTSGIKIGIAQGGIGQRSIAGFAVVRTHQLSNLLDLSPCD